MKTESSKKLLKIVKPIEADFPSASTFDNRTLSLPGLNKTLTAFSTKHSFQTPSIDGNRSPMPGKKILKKSLALESSPAAERRVEFNKTLTEKINFEKERGPKEEDPMDNSTIVQGGHKLSFVERELQYIIMEERVGNQLQEKMSVKNLERWIDTKRHKHMIKAFEPFNKQKQQTLSAINNMDKRIIGNVEEQKGPELRKGILDLVMKDGESEEIFLTEKDISVDQTDEKPEKERSRKNLDVLRKPTVMKSLESKKTELNKGLINEILLSKVIRKMKNGEQSVSNEPISGTQESEILTNDTVNNFKTLQMLFKNSAIIDYEQLYTKINLASQKYGQLFDFKEDLKKIEDDKSATNLRERLLTDKFLEFKRDIEMKKNLENKLRLMNFSDNKKIKMQKEMLQDVERRYQVLLDNISSQKASSSRTDSPGRKPGKVTIAKRVVQKNDDKSNVVEDFMKFRKVQEEKEKAIALIEKEISRLNEEMKANSDTMNRLQTEMEEMRMKKSHIQIEIKDILLKKMREHEETKNESLIWIIKAFWRIEQEFPEDCFPSWLDHKAIKFLYEYAKLDNELQELKNKKKNEFNSLPKDLKLENPLEKDFKHKLEEVKEKFQVMKRQKIEIRQIGTSTFKRKNSLERKWEDHLFSTYENQFGSKNGGSVDDIYNESDKYSNLNKSKLDELDLKIKEVNDEIEKIKRQELIRLFEIHKRETLDEKFITRFQGIMTCLFGVKELYANFQSFMKFKKNSDSKHVGSSDSGDYREEIPLLYQKMGLKLPAHLASKSEKNHLEKMSKNHRLRDKYSDFYTNFLNSAPENINYRYNFSYNYFPNLQASGPSSCFYKPKSQDFSSTFNKEIEF